MFESRIIYEFSDFRVDTANKTLQRAESVIPLTPKVFDTLVLLLENAENLVEKDVLIKTIWRDSFVEESNLTFNIKMLRKALGDDATHPTFIENIPRRGYRFLQKVKIVTAEKVAEVVELEPLSTLTTQKSYTPYFVIGAVCLLAILGFTFFWRNPLFNTRQSFQQINTNQLTSTGKAFYAIISPDGKYIMHAKDDGGKQSLWIRQTAETRDIEIVPPAVGQFGGLAVSPDNKSVYYTFWQQSQLDAILFQVPILGGTSKQIISNLDSGISFSADGNEFAFYRTTENLSQLLIAKVDGTNQRVVAERTAPETFETDFGDPIWKPNQRKILAIAASNLRNAKSDIIEIDIETGAIKPFIEAQWRDIQQIAWLKNSNNLLLTAIDEDSDTNQIWHIDSTTGKYRKVTSDLKNYRGISLTDDEKTLVTTQTEQVTRLLKTTETFATTTEILSETGNVGENEGLTWTANNELIFSVGEHEHDNISILDQSGLRPITVDTKGNRQPTICGNHIVYVANFVSIEPNKLRLWRMEKDGKNPQRLTTDETESEMYPHCSPKSEWVVYQKGWDKTSIWKVPITGGQPIQLTQSPSFQPNISPDGKSVAFYNLNNFKWSLAVISLEDGKILREIPIKSTNRIRHLRWTSDGKNLAYADTQRGVSNIWLQPIDGNSPSKLTNFDADLIYYFDWSPDGKNLAYTRSSFSSDVFSISDAR